MRPYIVEAIRCNNIMPMSKIMNGLYRDEEGDVFLLMKGAAIYLDRGFKKKSMGDAILRCHVWSKNLYRKLQINNLILDEKFSDEEFHVLMVDLRNLGLLCALGGILKRRMDMKGTAFSLLEKRLGHEIHLYDIEKYLETERGKSLSLAL